MDVCFIRSEKCHIWEKEFERVSGTVVPAADTLTFLTGILYRAVFV